MEYNTNCETKKNSTTKGLVGVKDTKFYFIYILIISVFKSHTFMLSIKKYFQVKVRVMLLYVYIYIIK